VLSFGQFFAGFVVDVGGQGRNIIGRNGRCGWTAPHLSGTQQPETGRPSAVLLDGQTEIEQLVGVVCGRVADTFGPGPYLLVHPLPQLP